MRSSPIGDPHLTRAEPRSCIVATRALQRGVRWLDRPRLKLHRGEVNRPKALVTRDLSTLLAQVHPGWGEQSMAQLGERTFAQKLLMASTGDPFETSTPDSALSDLRDLRHRAGATFDAEQWLLLSDEHGEIGVVLPQVYERDRTSGTLFYIGIMPDRRGHGLGLKLHQFGLHRLRELGAMDYRGSTDATNTSMLAIFKANGCDLESQARPF